MTFDLTSLHRECSLVPTTKIKVDAGPGIGDEYSLIKQDAGTARVHWYICKGHRDSLEDRMCVVGFLKLLLVSFAHTLILLTVLLGGT